MLNSENQEQLQKTITENKYTFVDVFATWCGPCKALLPILDSIEQERTNVTFIKADIELHQELAKTYNIRSVPTMLIFDEGVVIDRIQGFKTKDQILKFIDSNCV